MRFLALLCVALMSLNVLQLKLGESGRIKLKLQNKQIIEAEKARADDIKRRNKSIKKLSDNYKSEINYIRDMNYGVSDMSCEDSLNLIVNSIKESEL